MEMTREQARAIALKQILKDCIEKGLDTPMCFAPKKGKNSWSNREYAVAILNDENLEESDNPIDGILNLEKWMNERGKSLIKEEKNLWVTEGVMREQVREIEEKLKNIL